jgi:hypothetical protein
MQTRFVSVCRKGMECAFVLRRTVYRMHLSVILSNRRPDVPRKRCTLYARRTQRPMSAKRSGPEHRAAAAPLYHVVYTQRTPASKALLISTVILDSEQIYKWTEFRRPARIAQTCPPRGDLFLAAHAPALADEDTLRPTQVAGSTIALDHAA